MDATLQTIPVTIPADRSFASLDIVADFLAVLETNTPFNLTDERSFIFEGIDRACRVNVKKEGFKFRKLKVMRPAGVTGEIRVVFSAGDGVEFIDGRLQYTSDTTQNFNAAFAVTALPAQTRSRFLPRFLATAPLVGDPVYAPDITAGPKITGGASAGLNLLAPADPSVSRRVVRLISGASAKIGRAPSKMGIAGQCFELTTAAPERVLDGSESLFGLAAADAELTVFETLQSTLPAPALAAYPLASILPDPFDRPTDIPRFLRGSGGFSASFAVNLIAACAFGMNQRTVGLNTLAGWAGSIGSGVSSWNFAFSSADVAGTPHHASVPEPVDTSCVYFTVLTQSTTFESHQITCDNGQQFAVPHNFNVVGGGWSLAGVDLGTSAPSWAIQTGCIRAVYPWNGAPHYYQQLRVDGNWS